MLGAPKAPRKIFGQTDLHRRRQKRFLIGRRPGEKFAQCLKWGGGGGGEVQGRGGGGQTPTPREMLSCFAKLGGGGGGGPGAQESKKLYIKNSQINSSFGNSSLFPTMKSGPEGGGVRPPRT